MEIWLTILLVVAVAVAVVRIAWSRPVMFLAVLVIGIVAVNSSRAATLRLAIVADTEINRSTADGLVAAASRIWAQAGVELEVTSYTPPQGVPAGTNPHELLGFVGAAPRNGADIAVYLTTRVLSSGDHDYYGYSTVGPACNAHAASIVQLTFDGSDDLTLAHELGHAVGLEHDTAYGWLMSAGNTSESRTFSPESLARIPELMACHKPAAVPAPAEAQSTGGGGSLGARTLFLLCLLAAMPRRK